MNFIYKIDYGEPKSNNDYAIRYCVETEEEYAKIKGQKEFKTDFKINNTAFDIYLGGIIITKEEYDNL